MIVFFEVAPLSVLNGDPEETIIADVVPADHAAVRACGLVDAGIVAEYVIIQDFDAIRPDLISENTRRLEVDLADLGRRRGRCMYCQRQYSPSPERLHSRRIVIPSD